MPWRFFIRRIARVASDHLPLIAELRLAVSVQ